MTTWTYRDALEALWRRSSYERGLITNPFGAPEKAALGLRRTRALLAALGDPQLALPRAHVAGSQGKGSTGAFIASAAGAAGWRAGLYSSPHLHRFPERIAIDGAPITDAEFAAVAREVAAAAEQAEAAQPDLGTISTFEMITAMGFLAFARAQCDLAVIEVGLGGLYDSTNVIDPLVSVITRLDYEHTAVLGDTLTEIAQQKAGIMRPGVPCVVSPQEPEAAVAIAQVAAATGTPLLVAGRDWSWRGDWRAFSASGPWGVWEDLSLGIAGPHQVENACTALAALHELSNRGLRIPEEAVRRGLAAARWPGRFEQVDTPGRHYVLDGAHTPAAARALAATWRDAFGDRQATAIIGMGSDKDVPAFLGALAPILGRVIATRAASPRAADPAVIVAAAAEVGLAASETPSVDAAMRLLTAGEALALATGSLFVAGEVREALGLAEPDHEWAALNAAHQAAPTGAKTG